MTTAPKTDTCLIVLTKRPKLGVGKQRLAKSIGIHPAKGIAEALLECVFEDLKDWARAGYFSVADDTDLDWAQAQCEARKLQLVHCLAQGAGNLGHRIHGLETLASERGFNKRIYIGSDAPVLSAAMFLEIESDLDHFDVVLIPAIDGGVVLMASKLPWPDLTALPWSESDLGRVLRESCERLGMSVLVKPVASDIDVGSDLISYIPILKKDQRRSRRALFSQISALGLSDRL